MPLVNFTHLCACCLRPLDRDVAPVAGCPTHKITICLECSQVRFSQLFQKLLKRASLAHLMLLLLCPA